MSLPNYGQREPASDYDFFTGGGSKTPDLTIYYNVALDNLQKVQRSIAAWPTKRQHAFLAEYFWKAHLQQRNSNGYQLTSQDSLVILELCEKLDAIRNFQSHIWHDNEALRFSNLLYDFVSLKYEEAKAALFAEFPGLVTDYEQLEKSPSFQKFDLFKWVPEKRAHFITEEGRIFFLSFFLTTGQMNQFLQQRKGFKRADIPLFKLKRMLYTYYCHRDGATITTFNQEEHLLENSDSEERKHILKARTAYKLVNYLYNYPDYWANPTYMPLFDKDGQAITSVLQLKDYIEERPGLLPGFHFSLVEKRVPPGYYDSATEKEAYKKLQEDKFRKGVLHFTVDDIPDYQFQVDYPTLYRLVLLEQLHKQESEVLSPVALLIENLRSQAANRSRLHHLLTRPVSTLTDEDYAYLTNKTNQFLRGDRHLTELGIIYFEKIEKGNAVNERESFLLANYLRPVATPWQPLPRLKANQKDVPPETPEPIQVYQQDYIMTTTQHFRAGNRFMYYTAKYLQDFAGDLCYWGMERFDMGQKGSSSGSESLLRIKTYLTASAIAQTDDYRLTMEEDHVYLAVLKDATAQRNHERFYQFAIGPQAMRYLAAYVVSNKKDYANRLRQFLETLATELQQMRGKGRWEASDGYVLLEKAFVPGYLQERQTSLDQLKSTLRNRINNILSKWQDVLAHRYVYSRSEKNRMIMDAYRFFDWPAGNNGHPRFLRASEYNEMSVCHYSLHLKGKDDGQRGKPTRFKVFKNKFDHLYEDLFQLHQRKPPIPSAIVGLLKDATSLDHLMELVIDNRRQFLQDQLRSIEGLPSQLLKKVLPAICRLTGISIPANLLREQERGVLQGKHATTIAVQPFPIPPALVVKYFFPEKYMRGKPAPTVTNKDGKAVRQYAPLDILSEVRKNQSYRKRLYEPFYDVGIADTLYPHAYQKKQREKLIGNMNTACAEDILLWRMAQDYLGDNDYTRNLATYLSQVKDGGRPWGELLKLSINVDLARGSKNTLYCSVLMHQLDDLMFLTHWDELRACAQHFLKRCGDEKELWENELTALRAQSADVVLPDGSKQAPLPFELLRRERELIWRTGRALAGYLLQLERKILGTALEKHGNKTAFHQGLMAAYRKSAYSQKFTTPFLNFESVLVLAVEIGMPMDESLRELLSAYRNISFHNDIPVNSSFSWITREGQAIRSLLEMEQDLHARKDRSMYALPEGKIC